MFRLGLNDTSQWLYQVQWNPFKTDIIETTDFVLCSEVSVA